MLQNCSYRHVKVEIDGSILTGFNGRTDQDKLKKRFLNIKFNLNINNFANKLFLENLLNLKRKKINKTKT